MKRHRADDSQYQGGNVWLCEECAELVECDEAPSARTHGTLWAHAGSVVG